jgi:hypothetical protein
MAASPHSRFIVRGAKGNGLVDEHNRHHLLQRNILHAAIVDCSGLTGRDAYYRFLQLVELKRMLPAELTAAHREAPGLANRLSTS